MMTTELMYDLAIDILHNGHIELTQWDNGNEDRVVLHPDQFALIAKLAGFPVAGVAAIAAENRRLRRRLEKLDELIRDFVLADYYRSEILERCGQGMEIITVLDALVTIAEEFVADLDEEMPGASFATNPGRAETHSAIPTPCRDEKNDSAAPVIGGDNKPAAEGQMNLAGVE